ncbi:MAG: serine hydrolase domain-containing protein [Pseudomonadota bacterium]
MLTLSGIRPYFRWSVRAIRACVVLGLLISATTLHADDQITNLRGDTIDRSTIDGALKELVVSGAVPGVALAVVSADGAIYQNTVGFANSATQEPLRHDSVFEAASLSKPVFAYYVIRLAEKGIIELDKPLFDYLPHPGFVPEDLEAAKTITARMVLSHTTGMPNWARGEPISLSGQPGRVFSYSGEAFQFLTAAIGTHQGLGWGQELGAQMDEVVFAPLKMSHSSFLWNDTLAERKVYGHKDGEPTDKQSIGNGKSVGGAYSLHSTIGDYARFVQALIKREGLSDDTWRDILAAHIQLPDDHEGRDMGQFAWSLGLAIKQTDSGNRYVHTGNNHDFQTYMEFDPVAGIGLVYFTNSSEGAKVYDSLSQVMGL